MHTHAVQRDGVYIHKTRSWTEEEHESLYSTEEERQEKEEKENAQETHPDILLLILPLLLLFLTYTKDAAITTKTIDIHTPFLPSSRKHR